MEPGSRAAQSLHLSTAANIIGTLIALITLTLPVFATSYFSSDSSWQAPSGIEQARK
jgi:hypothetical protein